MAAAGSPTWERARSGSLVALAGACLILVSSPAAGQQATAPGTSGPSVVLLTEDPCCQFDPRIEFWLGTSAHVSAFQVYPGLGAVKLYPYGSETSIRLDRGRHAFRYLGLQARHARTVFDWHFGHYTPFRSGTQPYEHVVVIASDRPLTAEALASGRAFKHAPGDSEAGEVVARLVAAVSPEGARVAMDRGAWLRFAVPNASTGTVLATALSGALQRPLLALFRDRPECDPRHDEHCTSAGEIEVKTGSSPAAGEASQARRKEATDDESAAEARIRALLAQVARLQRRGEGPRIEVYEDAGSLLARPDFAERVRRTLESGRATPSLRGERERLRPDRGRRSFSPYRPRLGSERRPHRPSRADWSSRHDRGSDRSGDRGADRGSDRGSSGGSRAEDGAGD